MSSSKKRRLPRHVDGRVKVFLIPLKYNFIKFVVIATPVVILLAMHFTPVTMFFSVLFLGLVAAIYSEFNNKETGLDMIKDIIRYAKEGELHFERSCKNVPISERLIFNKIKGKQK